MENNKERETGLVAGKIAALKNREPILKDPEGLTEDIMNAIRENPMRNDFDELEKSTKLPVIIILQRLLAAASVCLFLVFGYEEYVVVDKISRLEKQNAAISRSSQYQAALNLKKAMGVFISDPEMRNRYKDLKTRKINLQTLLRAAIYADVTGLSPDALKFMNIADKNAAIPHLLSILKQFDSTDNNIQR